MHIGTNVDKIKSDVNSLQIAKSQTSPNIAPTFSKTSPSIMNMLELSIKMPFRNIGSHVQIATIHKTNTCLDCEHCNKVLNSRNERRNHIEQNHPEEAKIKIKKCFACDKKFRIGQRFNAHWNKCRQNQVGCQICKEIFSTKEVMLAHARVMHVTHVKLFWSSSCPDCKLTFPSMAEVEEHVCLVKLSSTKHDLNLDNIDVTLEWLLSKCD
jgi:thiol-disulfide isomerase/thioredoxin